MQATKQGNELIRVQFRDKFTKKWLHQKDITRAFLSKCFSMKIVAGYIQGKHIIDINGYYVIDV